MRADQGSPRHRAPGGRSGLRIFVYRQRVRVRASGCIAAPRLGSARDRFTPPARLVSTLTVTSAGTPASQLHSPAVGSAGGGWVWLGGPWGPAAYRPLWRAELTRPSPRAPGRSGRP